MSDRPSFQQLFKTTLEAELGPKFRYVEQALRLRELKIKTSNVSDLHTQLYQFVSHFFSCSTTLPKEERISRKAQWLLAEHFREVPELELVTITLIIIEMEKRDLPSTRHFMDTRFRHIPSAHIYGAQPMPRACSKNYLTFFLISHLYSDEFVGIHFTVYRGLLIGWASQFSYAHAAMALATFKPSIFIGEPEEDRFEFEEELKDPFFRDLVSWHDISFEAFRYAAVRFEPSPVSKTKGERKGKDRKKENDEKTA